MKETQAMKKLLAVLVSVVGISSVMAGNEPFQLSLTPDIALSTGARRSRE